MLASDFQQKLRKLNKSLRIYAGNESYKSAGIYHVVDGEVEDICGIDKNYVFEWPEYTAQGKMVKGGWRRALQILIGMKLIDRRESYKHFGYWTEHREPVRELRKSRIDEMVDDAMANSISGYRQIESPITGKTVNVPVYKTDDIVDVGRSIAKQSKASPGLL